MRLLVLVWDIRSVEEFRERRRSFIIRVLLLLRGENERMVRGGGKRDGRRTTTIIPNPIRPIPIPFRLRSLLSRRSVPPVDPSTNQLDHPTRRSNRNPPPSRREVSTIPNPPRCFIPNSNPPPPPPFTNSTTDPLYSRERNRQVSQRTKNSLE